jgi:putative sigma-54 modulation protein
VKIDIRMATKRDSSALRQFAEHALVHKMGSRAEGIRCARIRLQDVNGPRGGVDKICRIRLEVAGRGDVSVSGEAAGWYEAVTIAVINARTALDRRIGRVRDRKPREGRGSKVERIAAEDAKRGVA